MLPKVVLKVGTESEYRIGLAGQRASRRKLGYATGYYRIRLN